MSWKYMYTKTTTTTTTTLDILLLDQWYNYDGAQQNPISFVFQICLVILLQFLRNNIMWLCFAGCVYSKRDVLDLISNLRSRTGYTNITGQHNLTSAIYLQGQQKNRSNFFGGFNIELKKKKKNNLETAVSDVNGRDFVKWF